VKTAASLLVASLLVAPAVRADDAATSLSTPAPPATPTAYVYTATDPYVPAPAPDSHALNWNERWPRFRAVEYAASAVLGPLAIAEYFLIPAQPQAHWVGGILFDDAARSALRLHSPSDLDMIRALSDVVDVGVVVLAVGVDSFLVPLARGSRDVAWQAMLMDVEAFSVSSVVAITGYDTVGRGRPLYEDCQHNPSFDKTCLVSPTASFPSGHVNEAFTAAGLSCAHHAFLPLYGSSVADALACARDVTLATTTGVMRMMGDRHWGTDVIAGGLIGFGFGYGLPTLLHYAVPFRHAPSALTLAPLTGNQVGVMAAGRF
jgi:membrane-associated phospholipid phosphatase